MSKLLAFLLVALPITARAKQALFPFASSTCKFRGHSFEVKLSSVFKPGDPEDDSGGAQLVQIGGKEAERRTGKYLGDGAFNFVNPGEGSLCEKVMAYAVGNKLVAVLYQEDNRPFQPLLHAAFYDPDAKRVVRVEAHLGPLGETIPAGGGFAFSTIEARSDADSMSRKSPWGKEISGTDKDLGAFRRVSLVKGKVAIAFDPELSYEKSPWKAFYPKKETFLSDAGWDNASKTFKNVVVYELSHFDRREGPEEQKCIGMTDTRKGAIKEDHWRCLKLLH